MDAFRPLDCWSYNTLQRTRVVGLRTYERTRQRKVEWPVPPQNTVQDREEPFVYTSLDEAFSRIVRSMSETTKQCKRYYRSHPPAGTRGLEYCHCKRFHDSKTHHSDTVPETNMQQARHTDICQCIQAREYSS